MKKALIILINILLFSQLLFAQEDVLSSVKAQLKAGNAKELARYLNDIVEINMDGEKGNYSKGQAEFILKDFFRKYPVSDFQEIHKGRSKEGLTFIIGKYTYGGGSFRVYIVVKQFRGNYLIDTIDFSKE